MANWHVLYWLVVGALFGLGVVSILSIGVILLALGIALLVVGAARVGGRGLWAGVVGFGLAPALLLLWDLTSWPWACNPGSNATYSPITYGATYRSPNYYTCVDTFVGPLTTYHVLAAIFGGIALVGILIGLAVYLRGRSRADHGLRTV